MIKFVILISLLGLGFLITGLILSNTKKKGKQVSILERLDLIAENGLVGMVLSITATEAIQNFYRKFLRSSDTYIKIKTILLLKMISVLIVILIVLAINSTNYILLKNNVFILPIETDFIRGIQENNSKFKIELQRDFYKYLSQTSEFSFSRFELMAKFEDFLATSKIDINWVLLNDIDIEEFINEVSLRLKVINDKYPISSILLLWGIGGYLIPDIILFGKMLIYGNKYKHEAIKLENIFELLGGIKELKTYDILTEMAKQGGVYGGILRKCRDKFIVNKEAALEELRMDTRNRRLSRISDSIRVYALSDKDVALQMIERQRIENEEGALITLEEDMDVIDIVAFLSVIPILYQLANMILMPMLDSINKAFGFF
jgi:hypothetical protein